MKSIRKHYEMLFKEQKNALKGILLILAAFTVIYTAVCGWIMLQKAGKYALHSDTVEKTKSDDYGTVYTGSVRGMNARFTVSKDGSVLYELGSHAYGPFRIESSSVGSNRPSMTRLDIYLKDALVLSCDYEDSIASLDSKSFHASSPDMHYIGTHAEPASALYFDADGNIVDYHKTPIDYATVTQPTLADIIALSNGLPHLKLGLLPKIIFYCLGAIVCVSCALTILFQHSTIEPRKRFKFMKIKALDYTVEILGLDLIYFVGLSLFFFIIGL